LLFLNNLKFKAKLSDELSAKIKQALVHDTKHSDQHLQTFNEQLPMNLRLQLA